MSIHFQGDLLTAVMAVALAVSVLLRERRTRQQALYAATAFNIALFFTFGVLFRVSGLHLWNRLEQSVAAIIPVTMTMLLATFLQEGQVLGRSLFTLEFILTPILIIGTMSPLYGNQAFTLILVVYICGALAMAYTGVLQGILRTRADPEKRRLGFLLAGGAITVVLEVLTYQDSAGAYLPGIGNVAVILYLYFLGLAVTTYRVIGLREFFGRSISVLVIAGLLALLYRIMLLTARDDWRLFAFNIVVAAFLLYVLFDPLRAWFESALSKLFLFRRFEFSKRMEGLRRTLGGAVDTGSLVSGLLDGLWATRRLKGTAFYILAGDMTGFSLAGFRGPAPAERIDGVSHGALLEILNEQMSPLLLEIVDNRLAEAQEDSGTSAEVKGWHEVRLSMRSMGAAVILPVAVSGELGGFVTVDDARGSESFSADEIAMLIGVAEQAGTVLENLKLFEMMKERDRLAAIGEMAAGLAHEIRNPLGAMKGAAQCLDPAKLPSEDAEFVSIIVEEVERLNKIVSEFLDYSRPARAETGPVDLNSLAERTVKVMSSQIPAGTGVVMDLSPSKPTALGDGGQLSRVLVNLLLNAVQAMPSGGAVTIRTTARTGPFDRLGPLGEVIQKGLRSRGEEVAVSVTDTGAGIPEENLKRLFIPFFTTRKDGTGLGLAICRRIVEGHGGTIEVKSSPGSGSTFTVRLPAAPEDRG